MSTENELIFKKFEEWVRKKEIKEFKDRCARQHEIFDDEYKTRI